MRNGINQIDSYTPWPTMYIIDQCIVNVRLGTVRTFQFANYKFSPCSPGFAFPGMTPRIH